MQGVFGPACDKHVVNMGNTIRPACGCLKSSPTTLEKKYDVDANVLGQGTFAKVFLGTNKRTKKAVAVKVIDKASSRRDLLNTEIWILQNFGNHPNIVNFYDMYETEDEVKLVIELMHGGELFDLLDENGPYGEADAAKYLHAIASGLAYLHAGNVVHRDLKPENLLLTAKGPTGVLKISDFGLAKILIDEELMKVACGTWIYCAPEVLFLKQRRWGQYDIKCDIFSVGCILFIIMGGYHPFDFDGNDDEELMQECILSDTWDFEDPAWDNVSYQARDLIDQMLKYNPEERISAAELAVHPWTTGKCSYGRLSKNIDKDLKKTRVSLRNNKIEGAENVRKSLPSGNNAAEVAQLLAANPDQDRRQAEGQMPSPRPLSNGVNPGRVQAADGTGGSRAIERPSREVDAGTGGGAGRAPLGKRKSWQSTNTNGSLRSGPRRRQAGMVEDSMGGTGDSNKLQPGTPKHNIRIVKPTSNSPKAAESNVPKTDAHRWNKYDLKGNASSGNKDSPEQPAVRLLSVLNETHEKESNGSSGAPSSPEIPAANGNPCNGAGTGEQQVETMSNAEQQDSGGKKLEAQSIGTANSKNDLVARGGSGASWGSKKKRPEGKDKVAEGKDKKVAESQHKKPIKVPVQAIKYHTADADGSDATPDWKPIKSLDEWKAKRMPKLHVKENGLGKAFKTEDSEAKSPRSPSPAPERGMESSRSLTACTSRQVVAVSSRSAVTGNASGRSMNNTASEATPTRATLVDDIKKEGLLHGTGHWISDHLPGHHQAESPGKINQPKSPGTVDESKAQAESPGKKDRAKTLDSTVDEAEAKTSGPQSPSPSCRTTRTTKTTLSVNTRLSVTQRLLDNCSVGSANSSAANSKNTSAANSPVASDCELQPSPTIASFTASHRTEASSASKDSPAPDKMWASEKPIEKKSSKKKAPVYKSPKGRPSAKKKSPGNTENLKGYPTF